MLTIEKDIPIPSTKERKGENVELLRMMKPGDSVFFDAPIIKKATRFYRVAKKLGVAVIIRREGLGMRMWLVGKKGETAKTTAPKVAKKSAPVVAAKVKKAKKVAAPKKPAKKAKVVKAVKVAATDGAAKKAAKAERDRRYKAKKKAALAPIASSVAATAANAAEAGSL